MKLSFAPIIQPTRPTTTAFKQLVYESWTPLHWRQCLLGVLHGVIGFTLELVSNVLCIAGGQVWAGGWWWKGCGQWSELPSLYPSQEPEPGPGKHLESSPPGLAWHHSLHTSHISSQAQANTGHTLTLANTAHSPSSYGVLAHKIKGSKFPFLIFDLT